MTTERRTLELSDGSLVLLTDLANDHQERVTVSLRRIAADGTERGGVIDVPRLPATLTSRDRATLNRAAERIRALPCDVSSRYPAL